MSELGPVTLPRMINMFKNEQKSLVFLLQTLTAHGTIMLRKGIKGCDSKLQLI